MRIYGLKRDDVQEHMKNGDPENIIHTSKVATGMLDRYVYHPLEQYHFSHGLNSLGQTPWLMDILWHAPTTKKMHLLTETAAKMMRKRVKSLELPDFRDLASYLVSSSTLFSPNAYQARPHHSSTVGSRKKTWNKMRSWLSSAVSQILLA